MKRLKRLLLMSSLVLCSSVSLQGMLARIGTTWQQGVKAGQVVQRQRTVAMTSKAKDKPSLWERIKSRCPWTEEYQKAAILRSAKKEAALKATVKAINGTQWDTQQENAKNQAVQEARIKEMHRIANLDRTKQDVKQENEEFNKKRENVAGQKAEIKRQDRRDTKERKIKEVQAGKKIIIRNRRDEEREARQAEKEQARKDKEALERNAKEVQAGRKNNNRNKRDAKIAEQQRKRKEKKNKDKNNE